jgi:type II secretory ATPase GspE/PulE/Tfp pilus assembly ATPase PilB-like protein
MSDKKAGTTVADVAHLAEAVAVTEHLVHFVSPHPVPEESHRQALLEVIGQMFSNNASALYLDPGSETVRISIPTAAGLHELISVPLAVGRLVIEAIRREAVMKNDAGGWIHGPFAQGVLRVEQGGVERRLSVDLIPTVFGSAAVLRLMPSLPSGTGDLLALGLAPTQAPVVEGLLTTGTGLAILGGPDRDWVLNTCTVLLSRAALAGRRAVMVASRPGADVSGVARVEAGRNDAEVAESILRLAEADYTCIGVESALTLEVARAAATVATDNKALVVCVSQGRNVQDAVNQLFSTGISGQHAAALVLATCQLQIPLLCKNCAKWGDVSAEDIAFFGLDPNKKTNFFARTGCKACNGQITESAQVFEMCHLTEALREKIRGGMPFSRVEGELITMPGYTRLLYRFGEVIQEGRSSATEARQYYMWQIPNAPRTAGGATSTSGAKAV